MILQTRQKKALLATLDERTSPFTDTQAQKIFKNTANLTLKGNTFDANHLDSFLTSQYCSKPQSTTFNNSVSQHHTYGGINDSKSSSLKRGSYTMNSSVVRPSISFVSMNREHATQKIYVD